MNKSISGIISIQTFAFFVNIIQEYLKAYIYL